MGMITESYTEPKEESKVEKIKLETRLIFDCTDMPVDINTAFFDATEGAGNDVWVNWVVGNSDNKNSKMVDEWLIENTTANKGDRILISHWW